MPLSELVARAPGLHDELNKHLFTLEQHYRDLCGVEFTIENGRLFLLQTRVGKRALRHSRSPPTWRLRD